MGELDNTRYGFDKVLEEDNFAAKIHIDNYNKRLKLLEYDGEFGKLHDRLLQVCEKYRLGKVIGMVKKESAEGLVDCGYTVEGRIDAFFEGVTGYCVSYFFDKDRAVSKNAEAADLILKKAQEIQDRYVPGSGSYDIRTASEKDTESLSRLFGEVFKTYPTPMNDPAYIEKVMKEHVLFKAAYVDGKLASAASADMNRQWLNAEITDCATYKAYRGKGLLSELVYHLEQELKSRSFTASFSLSRALSTGINMVLGKHGYNYTGRLINNCNIMGSFEDMNIWVKKLSALP